MKKISILCLSVLTFISFVFLVKGETMEKDSIELILTTDKRDYAVGDKIQFKYRFVNNTSKDVYVLPWGGEYTINWIGGFDEEGNKLLNLPLVVYEMKFMPSKEDFICVKSSACYDITIDGKIIMAELSKYGRANENKIKGIFISFDNSAIFLERAGKFEIKGYYNGKEEWKDKGKALYGLKNVFSGKLESGKANIQISREK